MSDALNKHQKAAAEKKGIEDALKGEYKPSRAQDDFWYTHKKVEASEVYKEAFYRTRGAEPPKR